MVNHSLRTFAWTDTVEKPPHSLHTQSYGCDFGAINPVTFTMGVNLGLGHVVTAVMIFKLHEETPFIIYVLTHFKCLHRDSFCLTAQSTQKMMKHVVSTGFRDGLL